MIMHSVAFLKEACTDEQLREHVRLMLRDHEQLARISHQVIPRGVRRTIGRVFPSVTPDRG